MSVDRLGTWASAVCAVHCVITGVALSLLPVVGLQFLANPVTEVTFLALAVGLGVTAVVHGIRRHQDWRPSLIFLFGLVCLGLSHFVFGHSHLLEEHAGHYHVHEASPAAVVTAVMAGLSFVTFHLVNARKQAACSCSHCHPHG